MRFKHESATNGRLFPAFASTQTASYAGYVGSLSLSLSLALSKGSNLIRRMVFFFHLSSIGPIFFGLLLDLVIYFANVWNETEADNTHERRDFSKSSLRPFFQGALQLLLELKKLCNRS